MNNTNDKKDKNQLRVGAARICITPEPEYFPMEHFRNHMTGKPSIFSGKIAEDIFFRLILVENAHTRLVWAVLDLPGVPEAEEVTQLIADYAHIPESHVIYTCTHNHSGIYADNPVFEKWYGEPFTSKVHRYRRYLREEIIPKAIHQAEENLQPAVMGIQKGECYLNVNRNEKELGPKAGTYGFRVGGPTDRDLFVIRFDDLSGHPIALMYNYAVHACMMIHNNPEGKGTEISGDFVGGACRIIEKQYDDKAVVMFTSSAAGDMNPIMMSRVNIVEPDGSITTKELGAAGPIILDFMKNRLARDILTVNQKVQTNTYAPTLWAGVRKFTAPSTAADIPGPPRDITFRIGLMVLGDALIIVSNGEIFNQIGRRLKDSTPYKNTMMITHAGAWTSYVKDDSGDGIYETGAAKALEDLLKEYRNSCC
ncbi:neutral/alkaline non-lysosomal ceramidase N-terminal domain-containing protein [Hominifimenecus microfluidus]|uniref:neutral/alkaline non-lysosomal ceramidase N-terminal domain-containing protein n=1 Tax=Hominifimenecus microfluidus TaxID=2885348 RepID=UPI0032C11B65